MAQIKSVSWRTLPQAPATPFWKKKVATPPVFGVPLELDEAGCLAFAGGGGGGVLLGAGALVDVFFGAGGGAVVPDDGLHSAGRLDSCSWARSGWQHVLKKA